MHCVEGLRVKTADGLITMFLKEADQDDYERLDVELCNQKKNKLENEKRLKREGHLVDDC